MSEEKNVSISTLSDGAAIERFDLALQDVLNNVQDVNTDWKKARTITMKVTLKPNENRDISACIVEVDRKLAPIKPFGTMLFTGCDKHGKGYATEHVSNQSGLFEAPAADVEIEDCQDVVRLISETINQVRKGQIDPRVANAVGYLANVLIRAVEQGDMEKRLDDLEAVVKTKRALHEDNLFMTGTDA